MTNLILNQLDTQIGHFKFFNLTKQILFLTINIILSNIYTNVVL